MIVVKKLIDHDIEAEISCEYAQSLLGEVKSCLFGKDVIIWGGAGTGKFYGELLLSLGITVHCFIDRNADSIDPIFGLPVYTPDILRNKENCTLLIAASRKSFNEIINDIEANNFNPADIFDGCMHFHALQESVRTMRINYSAELADMKPFRQLERGLTIQHLELVVTTLCTLRCKHCAHMNSHYYFIPEGKCKLRHFPVDDLVSTVEKILQSVDVVNELSIVGGEPFLHPDLADIIHKLQKHNKVRRVEIATNGTVCPKQEVVKVLKGEKLYVTVSDYGKISTEISRLSDIFASRDIKYRIQAQGYGWDDLGDHCFRNRSEAELNVTYSSCLDNRYKIILDKKMYDCHRVANASNLGYYSPDDSECIDVLSFTSTELRKKISALYQLDHIPYCNYCNGKGRIVVAAEQYSLTELKCLRAKYGY
ncbi:radical SAM protein [Pelobacter propionicus]|uniref:Radical SAM domain protein n=1 Tax=Pelobacter propionicus (strain DSM 2379 / NBRC 103807 / OttBd1) TaxID=338966 RepID=A1AUB3_PELPD|nr:radical SAM protein [Pelobacter propionicus]ABL00934.1 Radical SAM domain protein [Pelobacter propionicus DSM 2379]